MLLAHLPGWQVRGYEHDVSSPRRDLRQRRRVLCRADLRLRPVRNRWMLDIGSDVLGVEPVLHGTDLQRWRYLRAVRREQLLRRRERELQLGHGVLFAAGLQFHEPLRHMRRSGRGMQ